MSTEGSRRSDDWLCEQQTEGMRYCLRTRDRLVHRRTAFQELELVETEDLGRVLALDGKLMLSERDEPFYHEMLVHPALLTHPHPEHVLVVGGGDGGTLREVLVHPSVTQAVLAEIDGQVIDVCRTHMPGVHRGALDDPRVAIHVGPGETFLPDHPQAFDVILVDSTDPIGPGEALFAEGFFRSCMRALKPGGLIALQAGTPYLWPEELGSVVTRLARLLPHLHVYLGFVPLYPSGMWAYVLAGLRDPQGELAQTAGRYRERGLRTRYYTPELHRGALCLPRFVEELVAQAVEQARR